MYISQNGFSWVDLPACTIPEKVEAAANITAWLTGDLAYVNSVSTDSAQPTFAEGEENAEAVPPTVVDVTEIERIAWIIAEISSATRIVPNGFVITNAKNEFVPNNSYGGLAFPVRTRPCPLRPPQPIILLITSSYDTRHLRRTILTLTRTTLARR